MSTPAVLSRPLRRVPVQGRSVARVQRMLDACAELVDEVGYEGLTTTLLAERAGVAIGSVYQFFPDKRAVVQALTLRNVEAYLARLAERIPAGELLDELRGLLREAETWLRAEPDPHGAVEALAGCRQALDTERREGMLLAARF